MNQWNNLDQLSSYQDLQKAGRVDLTKVMAGQEGSDRVGKYQVPMAAGLTYSYAAMTIS